MRTISFEECFYGPACRKAEPSLPHAQLDRLVFDGVTTAERRMHSSVKILKSTGFFTCIASSLITKAFDPSLQLTGQATPT